MNKIYYVGQLRKALEDYDDNDRIVIEIQEGKRHEDLYSFYVDYVSGLIDINDKDYSEVRLCI